MSQKQTVLDAALKQGIDAPYSCQGGICSSCLARVTSGTAEMTKNSILTDKEIADGLILTCQAHPTSETIYVDYDDVQEVNCFIHETSLKREVFLFQRGFDLQYISRIIVHSKSTLFLDINDRELGIKSNLGQIYLAISYILVGGNF